MPKSPRPKKLECGDDFVNVMVRIPRKLYEAYSALRRVTRAYEIDQSFEDTVNIILRHKLEEFVIMVQAIEDAHFIENSKEDEQDDRPPSGDKVTEHLKGYEQLSNFRVELPEA